MISDFDQLSEKIAQLAAMTQTLRRENAELRVRNAALLADNTDLSGRIQQAQQRVAALIDSLPAARPEGDAA
ncbi:MAG: cell division protein ZapB [Burkholderiaceae bacterium]